MKVVALVSGGKDSCFNMVKCVENGHEIVCLANLAPPNRSVQELDSWCFQTVGHNAIHAIAQCMELPLYQQDLNRSSNVTSLEYSEYSGAEEIGEIGNRTVVEDEVEDLFLLLQKVKNDFPEVKGVSCGAIFSDYQRFRVENVCARLGLISLTYLWRREQSELLNEMIESGVCAVMIKTASMGLNPRRDCGKTLAQLQTRLETLKLTADLNVCGEGGEYETFTIDCPVFKKRIVLDKTHVVMDSEDQFAPVGYLMIEEFHLEEKSESSIIERDDQKKAVVGSTWMKTSATEIWKKMSESQLNLIREMKSQHVSCQSRVAHCDDRGMQYDTCHIIATFKSHFNNEENYSDPLLQTAAIMQCVAEQLKENHFSLSDLVHNVLVLRSMSDFSTVNTLYSSYFDRHPPSRVCIEDNTIDGLVKIECIGARLNKQQIPLSDDEDVVDLTNWKKVLHVQSISEWAPACIGPYSQATQIDQIIRVAGQIAMKPELMTIEAASIEEEIAQCLRNVNNTLEALNSSLSQCVRCVVYYKDTAADKDTLKRMITSQCNSLESVSDNICFGDRMILAPVSALPRDAKVEFHVYATKNGIDLAVSQSKETANTITREVSSISVGKHKFTQIKLFGAITPVIVTNELQLLNSDSSIQALRVFSDKKLDISDVFTIAKYRCSNADLVIEIDSFIK